MPGICSGFPMFARRAIPLTPFFSISATAAFAASRLRKKLIAMSAPMSASASATALPIPRVPPVTSADFPFSSAITPPCKSLIGRRLFGPIGLFVNQESPRRRGGGRGLYGTVNAAITSAGGANFSGRQGERALPPPAVDDGGEADRPPAGRPENGAVDHERKGLAGLRERERRRSILGEADRAARFEEDVDQAQVVESALRQGSDHLTERDGSRRHIADLDLIVAEAGLASAGVRAHHLPHSGAAMRARHTAANGKVDAGEGWVSLGGVRCDRGLARAATSAGSGRSCHTCRRRDQDQRGAHGRGETGRAATREGTTEADLHRVSSPEPIFIESPSSES